MQANERAAADCEVAQTRCALLEDRIAELRVERGQLDTYKQVGLLAEASPTLSVGAAAGWPGGAV